MLQRALQLQREGRLAEAQSFFERVLAAAPDHAGVVHASGLLALQLGDPATAQRRLLQSIELEPGNAGFQNNLGVVLQGLERFEEAAAALRRAIALDASHAEAHRNLAAVLTALGRHDEAGVVQRRAEALRPPGLSADEALTLAVRLHQHGRLMEARELYDRVLAVAPDHPDALHFCGVLAHQLGEPARALNLIRRAAAIAPQAAAIQTNLGNVLKEIGQLDEAMAAYQQAIALDPLSADAHNNLGVVLGGRSRPDEAMAAFRRAIELDPRHAEAYHNLGNVLHARAAYDQAAEAYRASTQMAPARSRAYGSLAVLLMRQGRQAEARSVIEEWLALKPGDPAAKHLRAAITGADVPSRAADAYVQQVFDELAAGFDDLLLGVLDYAAPQLVTRSAHHAVRLRGIDTEALDVLDAGCGTGLCGPLLRALARRLVGVDLSRGMLERARQRQVYDELVQAELTAFLSAHPASFDLIISADTLNYFGELRPVYEAAAAALRPGGWFIFTLERAEPSETPRGYRLNPHGRYSHSEPDTSALLGRCGFRIESLTTDVLRQEAGEPVQGLLVVAGR